MKIGKEIEFGRFETGRALSRWQFDYTVCAFWEIKLIWIDPLEDLEEGMQYLFVLNLFYQNLRMILFIYLFLFVLFEIL